MDTSKLKKFAAFARRELKKEVGKKLKQVLQATSVARREQPQTVKDLEYAIRQSNEDRIIERVAYVWFNRFCALRFMDVNRYTRIGVVSPVEGQFQPEILAEAKMGHIDEDLAGVPTRAKILDLLSGKVPSSDPQTEAYRLLLVAACNDWHKAMPYLFEKIDDYTELLMPDDLLSGSSILAYTREALTPEACQDVEVIGWLYQFYISEKKDEVFAGLKKKKKITAENIPAATQLFTPHWIVRYLVENSLGRLWLLNHPDSRLIDQMEYYIKPEELETDFLKINSPEEIKICDPACGSGHMLSYAFDLLYTIYEEFGYEPSEIPEKILTHNLYGVEIDERAGELAAFALTMKARERYRRFFRKPVQPNICVLENISLSEETLQNYTRVFGKDLFSDTVIETLQQFRDSKSFGSLIIPKASKTGSALVALQTYKKQSLLGIGHEKELPVEQRALISTDNYIAICTALRQAEFLSPNYHVVLANPPYMGKRNLGADLSKMAKKHYPISKSDLFSMFIDRCLLLTKPKGYTSMITMQSWMFLPTYTKLRENIVSNNTLVSMIHLGARAFESIGGEVVSTTAFVINNNVLQNTDGIFLDLVDYKSESEKKKRYLYTVKNNLKSSYYFKSRDFFNIPGSPIAYWVDKKIVTLFESKSMGRTNSVNAAVGLFTCNNDLFMRCWHEVSISSIELNGEASNSFKLAKWVPYNKGGPFRRWYGNFDFVVNYFDSGRLIKEYRKDSGQSYSLPGEDFYFRKGVTWTDLTGGKLSVRYLPKGFIYDVSGHSASFASDSELNYILGFMNTKLTNKLSNIINSTFHFQIGDFKKLPYPKPLVYDALIPEKLIKFAREDWDSFEISWEFPGSPLIENQSPKLATSYFQTRSNWEKTTLKTQKLEKENNIFFLDAYDLRDEISTEVPLHEITLNCNPHYRYGPNKSVEELEALLLSDTMKEFISYAVGCMFGRYALEKPGLILANQGEILEDYLKQIPDPSFPADKDNVIPILDGDWFTDDITERFRKFLRLTFGDEHYEENLKFIENAIGKDLRKYFLKDFYTDHVKRYKKRPIYWLFSSPQGSFNALIYMHRYQPDTVSIVLNDYLREFRTKLSSRLEHLKRIEANVDASKAEKAKALKEIEGLRKTIEELDTWEREVIYPLATEKIKIDLDDGVKHNYPLFGTALKKIPGLSAKDKD